MASLPDTATWELYELKPTNMYTRLSHQIDRKYVDCPSDCIPKLSIFRSGGRWRYKLSIIQHVTELHVQCQTTFDKWNQGAVRPNKTTHAKTYIFHTRLLLIRYAHVSCETFGMDGLGCRTWRHCQTRRRMKTTCVCPRQRFIRVPTAIAYHIFGHNLGSISVQFSHIVR